MEIEIKYCYATPCELEVFEINGIKANKNDFGEGGDHNPDDSYRYGCGCYMFVANREPKQKILDKYGISKEEYLMICNRLENELDIGGCSWCE